MKLFTEQIPDDDVFQSLTAAEAPLSQSLQAADWQQITNLCTQALANESASPDTEQGLLYAKKSPYRQAPDRPAKAGGF